EALKKAQSDHVKAEEPAASPKIEQTPSPSPAPIFARKPLNVSTAARSRLKSVPLALLIMAAFAAVVFTANHFFMSRGISDSKAAGTIVTDRTRESRQEVAPKAADNKVSGPETPTLGDIAKTLPIARIGVSDAPSFVLNGIMYLEAGPKAIIDGNVVEEGDVIKGAIVKTINKNSVILNYKNLEISLNLKD
ncbi:MAG: hypothetical protein WC779_01920, partial [Candidatus Omnitrophota bacterium]